MDLIAKNGPTTEFCTCDLQGIELLLQFQVLITLDTYNLWGQDIGKWKRVMSLLEAALRVSIQEKISE
jgi:hypothetical protein